ncbi:MAG: RNA polymerase sigma factor [bacterium]
MDIITDNNFEKIMRQHYNEIFHYIRKQTNNTEDAKDLTQDVFMKIYNYRGKYNPKKASIRTWIYRIAHNHTLNHFKKNHHHYKLNIDDDDLNYLKESDDNVIEKLIQAEDVQKITNLMYQTLNKKHLKIMNLYFFSELRIKEIAKLMKSPIKTIYNTINVSIKKLKKGMETDLNE